MSSLSTHSIGGTPVPRPPRRAAGLDAPQMPGADYTAQRSRASAGGATPITSRRRSSLAACRRGRVTSALLVRSGWNGIEDIFSGADNFFLAYAQGAAERLVEKLGERRNRGDRYQEWTRLQSGAADAVRHPG
jgi:hypothetical protein